MNNRRELRDAFGCFPTGITVVTALDGDGRAVGVTANSFTSLSLDPPLLLWSIGRQSATFDIFNKASAFVVSVLKAGAGEISNRFAMKGEHFVDEMPSLPTQLGPPTFADVLAVFECESHARYEGGDHVILVGRIMRFRHVAEGEGKESKPLVYYRGRYRGLDDGG